MKTKTKTVTKLIPLIVTTQHRGVFFGFGLPTDKQEIRLERARMCVYWSSDIRGILGLASVGPSKTCKVSFEIPAINLRDVTAVMEVSEEALQKWNAQPWH